LVTHSTLCKNPLSSSGAAAYVQDLLDVPSLTVLTPSMESWVILARLMKHMAIRGNLLPDAVTASILEANGVKTIYTNDRDFWKFPALKPVDPFEAHKHK
jgi:predicted nucleic acid-binding protein